jgi:hypothetical protein
VLNPGTVTVSIRATSGGKPTGEDIIVGTTDGDTLATGSPYTWREITFSSTTSLTSGTMYAIVVRALSGNSSNNLRWRYDGTAPSYAGGTFCNSGNSGSTWNAISSVDFLFETYSESSSYVDATGNFSITSGFDGVATVLNIIQATGTFSISSSFSGVGSFTTFKDKTGTIAITSYLLGRLSVQSFFEWATSRPPIYDGTKVFDETSMSWIDNDGRGGGRFREAVVVIGQQADGVSKILFQEL